MNCKTRIRLLSVACVVILAAGTAFAEKGGKGGGNGNGADGGGETIFFRVTLSGDLQWQVNSGDPSTEPLSDIDSNGNLVVWRIASLDALNFLVNPNSRGDCMPNLPWWNRARINMNFLEQGNYTEGESDSCIPINEDGDRVYGDTLSVKDLTTDFVYNATGRDVRLNFTPDDISYQLHFGVIASNPGMPSGLDAVLRSLDEGDSLELDLFSWELFPSNNRKNRTECEATGNFNLGTSITITRDSTPCNLP